MWSCNEKQLAVGNLIVMGTVNELTRIVRGRQLRTDKLGENMRIEQLERIASIASESISNKSNATRNKERHYYAINKQYCQIWHKYLRSS